MYKILTELCSSYYCHKNVGNWAQEKSQNMFPREQKRSRTEQLDVGSGNWTIPICVAPVHAVSCLGRLLQPVPPQTKVQKPLHYWEGKMEITYRGRKSFENHISLFQLLKEKLVCNSILSIGGVCVGGCINTQNIWVWGEGTFTVVCQPQAHGFYFSLNPENSFKKKKKTLRNSQGRVHVSVCEGVWVTYLHI